MQRLKTATSSKLEAFHSDTEEEGIHVDEPSRRFNKVTGGPTDETEDLGPEGGNSKEGGGWVDERGYGVPILASDEVAKEPSGEFMQPAISPKRERRGSAFAESGFTSGDQTPGSRPTSRPSSVHGVIPGLSRFTSRNEDREDMHTPLEDVEEYEPLFPEDEDGKKKPMTAADRFKQRPGTLKHRFPSQDIWEDTPASALHVATVTTPDLPKDDTAHKASAVFEPPEKEAARKGEVSEADKTQLRPKEERLTKSKFAPHLRDDMPTRPGMQPRFPSSDIWEDSPESMHLVTTVQSHSSAESRSPPDVPGSKPTIPPRPAGRSKLGSGATESNAVAPEAKQPLIPSRPPKRIHQVPLADAKLTDPRTLQNETSPVDKKPPIVPEKPKPHVPARPGKKLSESAQENEQASSSHTGVKSKPTVPARSSGANAKFASVKAGFLSNLEKQLQHGPQGPPPRENAQEQEDEKEKTPLSDARKGRAKGPQRRKPASSARSTAVSEPQAASLTPKLSLIQAKSIWYISEEGELSVIEDHFKDNIQLHPTLSQSDPPGAVQSPLASNVASSKDDPSTFPSSDATPTAEKADPMEQPSINKAHQLSESFTVDSGQEHGDAESTLKQTEPQTLQSTVLNAEDSNVSSDMIARQETETGSTTALLSNPNPVEQSLPKSVSDKDLEEMTASADGKMHAAEEDLGRD